MDLITPTEWEARISIQNQEDGIVVLAEKLKKIAKANHVLLKLGDDGLLVQTSSSNEDDIYTDQVPALNTAPVDVAGAGDSLLIASAMAMATGANIWEVGLLGSLAAAVQVGRIGNIPLNPQELIKAINH
jgi:bifunctional ADP-heptose synthase (sugar kinase/adenylyltransferase)